MTVKPSSISKTVRSSIDSAKRASAVVSEVAKRQVHLGLHVEEDGPALRAINPDDGKSFYIPRAALGHGKQVHLLLQGAAKDVKERRVFSPYDSDRVLTYFDGVIGLVSVFLYEELGWERTIDFKENPKPVLLSVLCFFHIMVYWLNTHHFLKFTARDTFSLPQIWCLILYSLGLVLYPLCLIQWIEEGESNTYYYLNTAMCFFLAVFSWLTPIDKRGNCMYRLWQRVATAIACVYYGVATVLKLSDVPGTEYMLYIAPFFFVVPLGSECKPGDANPETLSMMQILRGAARDFKCGNIFSPYQLVNALDFYDAVIGLATVFIFIENDWQTTIGKEGIQTNDGDPLSSGLAAAMLCFFHVMGYWLNIHHNLKFSPPELSVLQVWAIVFLSLGMVFYPLCITAWIEGGSAESYYIVNLALCGFLSIFAFLTQIGRGRSNTLYRLWHKFGPLMFLAWYSVAFGLYKAGREQQWMIVMGPIAFMFPLGGEKKTIIDENPLPEKVDYDADGNSDDSYHDNYPISSYASEYVLRTTGDNFYDCPEEITEDEPSSSTGGQKPFSQIDRRIPQPKETKKISLSTSSDIETS